VNGKIWIVAILWVVPFGLPSASAWANVGGDVPPIEYGEKPGAAGADLHAQISEISETSEILPTASLAPQASDIAPLSLDLTDPDADADADADEAMAQLRSVNELSDIQPSDWAYQAVKTLIERYDVMTGYTDKTFRGNRPLSRYEFAAAMNAVIIKIQQLFITGSLAQLREDYALIRRLNTRYGAVLAELQTTLKTLDDLVAQLEKQQFSTTTKLSTQAVFAFTGGTNARGTTPTRIRLDFDTSFSGSDLLKTQLESGINRTDAIAQNQERNQNLLGKFGILADGGGLDFIGVDNTLRLSKLYYTFQPSKTLSVTIGTKLPPRDFIDYNRFANDSLTNFSSSFFMNNPLIVQNQIDNPAGAGAAVTWKPSTTSPFTLRGLYAAADGDQPGSTNGIFGDRNQGTLELEYAFSKALIARLQYTTATINRTAINAGGINFEWAPNRQFAMFGRLGVGKYNGFNSLLGQTIDFSPVTWALGGTIRNIVLPGSVAGLAIGQPFIERDLGGKTQTNIEAYYRFNINDNMSFSPTFLFVTNPDNQKASTVFEWAIRLVYSF
jgi:Carbohydrate-selective porin, OprB family/S-layer homology domain